MPRVSYKRRRAFATELLEHAFFGAFYTAISTRKNEDALTRAKLGSRMGREKTGISKLLSGPRNWQLSTIADLTEALDLRLEFSLVDRHYPIRRFTATGAQYDVLPSFASDNLITINTGNMPTTQLDQLAGHVSWPQPYTNLFSEMPKTEIAAKTGVLALPSPTSFNIPSPMRPRMIANAVPTGT